MVKTVEAEAETSQKDKARHQRKKQARREAKIMLKVERVKKAVQKAQKKLTQAQSNLDAEQTHLQDLEAKLQQIRTVEEPQTQEAPAPPTSQDAAPEEQQQAPTAQASSEELPELMPEDFQTQEAVEETYQEPLLMPTDTPPQADGNDLSSVDLSTDTPYSEEQASSQTEGYISSHSSDEQSTSPESTAENHTTTPEDTRTAEDNTSTWWQDETQSLIVHGNEEPELSNNPLASTAEKDKDSEEVAAGSSTGNKEEDLQA